MKRPTRDQVVDAIATVIAILLVTLAIYSIIHVDPATSSVVAQGNCK